MKKNKISNFNGEGGSIAMFWIRISRYLGGWVPLSRIPFCCFLSFFILDNLSLSVFYPSSSFDRNLHIFFFSFWQNCFNFSSDNYSGLFSPDYESRYLISKPLLNSDFFLQVRALWLRRGIF